MSSLVNPSRVRQPRTAGAAIERARLALVPVRTVKAPRAPFAVLVFVILAAGVVGLLMFNTQMQQSSFYATSLEQKADELAAQRQALEMELDALRDPQRLAEAGRGLGMVVPKDPVFLDLGTGKILGTPTAATPEDAMRTTSLPARRPDSVDPEPLVRKVLATPPPATPAKPGQSTNPDGPASPAERATDGRNDAPSERQGAPR